jgi:prepilin-type N-terminal cleavage/methylation domain-containing protein
MPRRRNYRQGFTLIELSIVLVVIGLIIGGILVGQDLISAAAVRAQISQIEKYNTAVHTFQSKYGYLPGDMPNPYAAQFGFDRTVWANGCFANGNGLIEGSGNTNSLPPNCGLSGVYPLVGESVYFWWDLSAAGLIEGGLSFASGNDFPPAKIGNGNYVTVWSGGYSGDGSNYYSIETVLPTANTSVGLTVQQAYNIDKKVDDGFPQSGSVMAIYPTSNGGWTAYWAAGGGLYGAGGGPYGSYGFGTPTNNATPQAATNCYDNNNATGPQQYSMGKNAALLNCAVSLKLQ